MIPPDAFAYLTKEGADAFFRDQIRGLFPGRMMAMQAGLLDLILEKLAPFQIQSLTPLQLDNIRPDLLRNSGIMLQLTPGQVAALPMDKVYLYSEEDVHALLNAIPMTKNCLLIRAMRPRQIQALTPLYLSRFTLTGLRLLTPEQVQAVTPAQRAALSDDQRAMLVR